MNATPLKILLVVFTVIIYVVSFIAVKKLGMDEGMVFVSDFGHPWRAQFNTDFSLHILLVALWVFWREEHIGAKILCALGCFMGGLFTFPYLIVSLIRCNGDVRKLMLGRNA